MSVVLDGSAGITLPDNGALSTSVGDVIIIGSTGAVTTPYQPSFHAIANANTTGVNTTNLKVNFQATEHNIGNHYNTSTSVFTAPVAGSYQFNVHCRFDGVSASYHLLKLYKNGSTSVSGVYDLSTIDSAYDSLNLGGVVYLQSNDTIHVNIYVSGDTSWNINAASSSFSGYLLG